MKNEYNPDIHHRRSIRLKNYDYSQKGLYFITICTHGHQCLFGKIDVAYPVGAGSKPALNSKPTLGSKPAPEGQPRIQFPSNRANLEQPGLQSGAGTEPACTEITCINPIRTEPARMRLNDYGRIVEYTWFDLVNHVDNIKLHEFIVMPNHVHGIIEIVTKSVGAGSKPAPGSKSAPGCRPPCHNYGKGGEIELETGANLEESGLQTGAGLEPARTEPARTEPVCTEITCINPIRAESASAEPARKRLVDSMHAESKPNQQLKIKPLSEIVRQLKTFSARRVNQLRKTPGKPVWQRNYYEHVIRNEPAYCKISEYILNNPRSWPEDRYYSEQSFNP